jgi:hypothetical protein
MANPPDTPLEEWIAGVDRLLAEIEARDATPASPSPPRLAPTRIPSPHWGRYGEITNPPEWVLSLMREAEDAGLYETGVERLNSRRGIAVNADCYGYDGERGLVVIQVRQCLWRSGRYNRVRKNYFLIGRTEQGRIFGHPVESPRRLKGLRTPEAVVRAVLCRIWQCADDELDHIVRQGDIALIPDVLPPDAVEVEGHELVLRETHRLVAEHLYRSGDRYYVAGGRVELIHTKGQHRPVRRRRGCYRIQVGLRAATWDFTRARLSD